MSIVTELKYTANLDKGVCMTPITPSFMGGDQEAHRITVDCYRQNSREPVDLSAAGVTAYFVRADGMTIPLSGETEGNKASVLLPAACYAVMGRFSLVIKLSLNDGTADSINTVFWGEGAVSRSRTDVVIDPDSVIPSLDELLAQIDAMETATAAANEAAASVEGFKAEINDQVSQLSEDILTKAPAINCEASGPLVTVTDAAAQSAVQLISHIEPVQEGEGDPSPVNKRPISGWNKASTMAAGKNLANAYLHNSQFLNAKVNLVAGKTYTLSVRDFVSGLFFSSANETINHALAYGAKALTYTAEESGVYTLRAYFPEENASLDFNMQLEVGNTATAYEPYQGQTLTADLPETVYGGDKNWGTGVLTDSWAYYEMDGTENIKLDVINKHNRFSISPKTSLPKEIGWERDQKSSHFVADGTPVGVNDKNMSVSVYNGYIYLRYDEMTTVDDLKAYLVEQKSAGTPVTVAYKVKEPRIIQLTPQQLSMLRGTNNVWSDCGDTSLVYVADTKMYIDQKLAAVAAATVNN